MPLICTFLPLTIGKDVLLAEKGTALAWGKMTGGSSAVNSTNQNIPVTDVFHGVRIKPSLTVVDPPEYGKKVTTGNSLEGPSAGVRLGLPFSLSHREVSSPDLIRPSQFHPEELEKTENSSFSVLSQILEIVGNPTASSDSSICELMIHGATNDGEGGTSFKSIVC
ncbi:hypothetical protein BT69DRAFT_1300960 [Atractiella rhizophila]|nr:hypothetical protein BT69DRAFT_1300960 [Atractiella rhizophila]